MPWYMTVAVVWILGIVALALVCLVVCKRPMLFLLENGWGLIIWPIVVICVVFQILPPAGVILLDAITERIKTSSGS